MTAQFMTWHPFVGELCKIRYIPSAQSSFVRPEEDTWIKRMYLIACVYVNYELNCTDFMAMLGWVRLWLDLRESSMICR